MKIIKAHEQEDNAQQDGGNSTQPLPSSAVIKSTSNTKQENFTFDWTKVPDFVMDKIKEGSMNIQTKHIHHFSTSVANS
jgi:hypothetical protein